MEGRLMRKEERMEEIEKRKEREQLMREQKL